MSYEDSLLDFGSGLYNGATAGAKAGGAEHGMAGGIIGGLGLGALSYFGGASQRRLEDKANKYSLEGMDQENQLGKLNVAETRRKVIQDREQQKRKDMFGQMLAQYFQKQAGK